MAETSLQEQEAPPETVKGSVNPVQQNTVSQSNLFIAGRIKYFIKNWEELTTDSFILNVVMGCKIDLLHTPHQHYCPNETKFSEKEKLFVQEELAKLLHKHVIIPSKHEKDEFVSTIFLTPKKDGSFRLILNLKKFNHFVRYQHFKMESLKQVIQMMKPGCFMASLDIRDAYYTVPIHSTHQKYLKFSFNGQLFQFTCMPNGLACAPRLFTKLLKPVYGSLREQALLSVGYIDDSYLQGDTQTDCQHNVDTTSQLFAKLGFWLHEDKSVFTPTQQLEFLGFVLNSISMTVSLTVAKAEKIKSSCKKLLSQPQSAIRAVAEVVGMLVASFPGVEMGPLYYRNLENDKIAALREHCGNYDGVMNISSASCQDLQWWINNVETACKPISKPKAQYEMCTDASLSGWGAVFQGISAGGQWLPAEADQHINCLELAAVFLGLQTFCTQLRHTHVCLHIDNTTAVTYINNMGGSHSLACNAKAREIWLWCTSRHIWLSAVHLPGHLNTTADLASRVFHDQTEWQLNPRIFRYLIDNLFQPNIDLFASRLNYQLQPYVAWQPDPGAFAIDAFTLDWNKFIFYAFPPFSLLDRVLQKIEHDQATGILVIPNWSTQTWFPRVQKLLIQKPLQLPYKKDILVLPYKPKAQHPLAHKLQLMACSLSANPLKMLEYRGKLQRF